MNYSFYLILKYIDLITTHWNWLPEHRVESAMPFIGFQHVKPLNLLQFCPVPQNELLVPVMPDPAHEPAPVVKFVFKKFYKYLNLFCWGYNSDGNK